MFGFSDFFAHKIKIMVHKKVEVHLVPFHKKNSVVSLKLAGRLMKRTNATAKP